MNITTVKNVIFGLKPTERTVNLLMQELGGEKSEKLTFDYVRSSTPKIATILENKYNRTFENDEQRIIRGGYLKNSKVEFISRHLEKFIHRLIPENVREIKPKKHFYSQGFYSVPIDEIRKLADMIKESSKEELEKIFKKVRYFIDENQL